MEAKNISQLVGKLKKDKDEQAELVKDPMKYLAAVENPMEDKTVFLTIVWIVGFVLLTAVVLGGIIIFNIEPDKRETAKVPEFLVAIGSTALGALVGLLSPSPSQK